MDKHYSCVFLFLNSLILLPPLSLSITTSSSPSLPPPPECREDERSALLEFKEVFRYPIDSSYLIAYDDVKFEPWKLVSWKLDGGKGNCCAWDGVECDAESGHVIGLDLCCTGLYASINSTSSIFRLAHLQKLNLAYTNFNLSPIPSAVENLPGLTSLNLSACSLTGQIPKQILGLTKLTSLDLSYNELELVEPSLGDLSLSLSKLEQLDLTWVNVSSPIPHALTNLSSLTLLTLSDCRLHGRLPLSIFSLPELQVLDMSSNSFSGNLPEFHWGGRLKSLFLGDTNLSGVLSASIGNLTQLIELDLSWNRFRGPIPSLANVTQLNSLALSYNALSSSLPSSLESLTQLTHLRLSGNQLTGQIPSQFFNLTQLKYLDLSFNMLSGEVHLDRFLQLKHFEVLFLSYNSLSVVTTSNMSATHSSQLTALQLASCNLREYPKLLQSLHQLSLLDLSSNNIHGQVPIWFQNVSRQNLMFLNLSSNSLTGFTGNSVNFEWAKLAYLDLSFNKLQGPLPLPPESIVIYRVSNNRLSGDIPPLLCSRSFIEVLDLAKNNFSGVIPECFSNLTDTLTILSLHNNILRGGIPQVADENCSVTLLDLNNNQLQGPLPRSLASCTNLQFLNIRDNKIEDMFPSWLGAITRLRVLILRSNRFYGTIEEPKTSSEFQSLQILDISRNNFENYLPAKYFQCWESMKISVVQNGANLDGDGDSPTVIGYIGYTYDFSLSITNKGMEMEYVSILAYFKAIDFSGNNFSGEIPESIANLKGLHLLNFSSNNLSGPIPPVLGGLSNLEALDLSGNRLFGDIPQQLTQLTFLESFDVSGNNLSGPIPRGRQFDTFKNTSYEGNKGLCGVPLSRICGGHAASPPPSSPNQNEDSDAPAEIEWEAVVMGYVGGLVISAVIGQKIIT